MSTARRRRIVRKENTNTRYRYLKLFPEKPRSLIHELYGGAATVIQTQLPDVMSFGYWMDKPRTKAITRRADSGRRHRSPVDAGLSGKKTETPDTDA